MDQPIGDGDAEIGKFRRALSRPCPKIDHLDRSGEGWEFNLEGDPASATSIDACHEQFV
jgi:hypothetical protein